MQLSITQTRDKLYVTQPTDKCLLRKPQTPVTLIVCDSSYRQTAVCEPSQRQLVVCDSNHLQLLFVTKPSDNR